MLKGRYYGIECVVAVQREHALAALGRRAPAGIFVGEQSFKVLARGLTRSQQPPGLLEAFDMMRGRLAIRSLQFYCIDSSF